MMPWNKQAPPGYAPAPMAPRAPLVPWFKPAPQTLPPAPQPPGYYPAPPMPQPQMKIETKEPGSIIILRDADGRRIMIVRDPSGRTVVKQPLDDADFGNQPYPADQLDRLKLKLRRQADQPYPRKEHTLRNYNDPNSNQGDDGDGQEE